MTTTTALSGNNPVSNVSGRAHEAVDRAAEKATPALERATTAAHRTIDKAADVTAPAAEWVTDNAKQLANRSTEVADACSAYVRQRPLSTVVGALAIGYFAGKLLR